MDVRPPDVRRRARLATAALIALVASTPATRTEPSPFGPRATEGSATVGRTDSGVSYSLYPVPSGKDDIPNSGRGQYDWLNVATQIPWLSTSDVYWRDELRWADEIERHRGTYDFSSVERGLAVAGARRTRFMFRVMAYCPGCGGNLTPDYVPRQSDGTPDWNSPVFQEAWERLMAALGSAYGDDPRLGPIDVGGYGDWGEWIVRDSRSTPITLANARRMIKAVIDAFPEKFVLINYIEPYPRLAIAMSRRVGLRLDCIGGLPMTLATLPPDERDIWRRSPVVGEWCPTAETDARLGLRNVHDLHLSMLSSGNYPRTTQDMSGAESESYVRAYLDSGFRYRLESLHRTDPWIHGATVRVSSSWSNTGVAPTYDPRRIVLVLRDRDGTIAWRTPLSVDLGAVTPERGAVTFTDDVHLPSDLRGTYDVRIVVEDPVAYLEPMRLANTQRGLDGSYWVGEVVIG